MKTVHLKLTSAIAVGGHVIKPPSIVEVTEGEAKDLLHRGKAVLATEEDADEPIVARTLTDLSEEHPDVADFNDDQAQVAADAKADAGKPAPAPKPNAGRRK